MAGSCAIRITEPVLLLDVPLAVRCAHPCLGRLSVMHAAELEASRTAKRRPTCGQHESYPYIYISNQVTGKRKLSCVRPFHTPPLRPALPRSPLHSSFGPEPTCLYETRPPSSLLSTLPLLATAPLAGRWLYEPSSKLAQTPTEGGVEDSAPPYTPPAAW